MKTKVWIFLLAAIFLLCCGASLFLLLPSQDAAQAQIISQGKLVRTVDLGIDQSFTVPGPKGNENTVTVSGGKIAVTAASCPDHYCMDRGFCAGGAEIVCLPNKLVIRFLGPQEIDGVAG